MSRIVQNKCDNDSFFHCKYSRKCIPKQWLCDQVFDCGLVGHFLDSSDEGHQQNCTKKCPINTLPCANGECLHISKFCDGKIDCPTDEFFCDDKSACKNLKCDYGCSITSLGPHCYCPPGHDIINSTKCLERQECSEDGSENCDQKCFNIKGQNTCSCVSGFEQIDNRCFGVNSKLLKTVKFCVVKIQTYIFLQLPQPHQLFYLR